MTSVAAEMFHREQDADRNTVYAEHGCKDRDDYLLCLSEDYAVPLDVVRNLAELLGRSEDFDGLVVALEDVHEREREVFGRPLLSGGEIR